MWLERRAPGALAAIHMSCPPISWGTLEGCPGEADGGKRGQEAEPQAPSTTSVRKLHVCLTNVQKRKPKPREGLRLPSTAGSQPVPALYRPAHSFPALGLLSAGSGTWGLHVKTICGEEKPH